MTLELPMIVLRGDVNGTQITETTGYYDVESFDNGLEKSGLISTGMPPGVRGDRLRKSSYVWDVDTPKPQVTRVF